MNIHWKPVGDTRWDAMLDGVYVGKLERGGPNKWVVYTEHDRIIGSAPTQGFAMTMLNHHLGGKKMDTTPKHERPGFPPPETVGAAAEPAPIKWPDVVKPAGDTTITTEALDKLMKASKWKDFQPIYTDSSYVGLNRTEWNKVLAETNTRTLKYVPTVHDCDDFAFLARGVVPAVADVNGIAVVLDFSGKHAYNLVLVCEADGTRSVEAVEPQQDRFVRFSDVGREPYSAVNGMALW